MTIPVKMTPRERRTATIAEQPTDQRRGQGRQKNAHHNRQSHVVSEDGCTEAADAGKGTNAQEQLPGTAEDHIEANGVTDKGQPENGDTHEHT